MAREPIVLGRFTFSTKKAAADAVRALVARSPEGVPLAGDDLALAEEVLRRHPHAEYKLRAGMSGIVVKKPTGFDTRCLWIQRMDGILEDYSWRVALGIVPAEPLLGDAGRRVVFDGVMEFKRRALADGPVPCPVLGVPVAWEDAHVDHAPPWTFDEIVRAFREQYGEPPLRHEGTRDFFVDPTDAERFRAFHDARAALRIVHRTANLSALRTRAPTRARDRRQPGRDT